MLFGKLMLQQPNVLLMDEPTNHWTWNRSSRCNSRSEKYAGTLIFVSHDREFVSSLATQVIELGGETADSFPGQLRGLPCSRGLGVAPKSLPTCCGQRTPQTGILAPFVGALLRLRRAFGEKYANGIARARYERAWRFTWGKWTRP